MYDKESYHMVHKVLCVCHEKLWFQWAFGSFWQAQRYKFRTRFRQQRWLLKSMIFSQGEFQIVSGILWLQKNLLTIYCFQVTSIHLKQLKMGYFSTEIMLEYGENSTQCFWSLRSRWESSQVTVLHDRSQNVFVMDHILRTDWKTDSREPSIGENMLTDAKAVWNKISSGVLTGVKEVAEGKVR